MKYRIVTLLVLVLALGVEVNGQGESSNNAGSNLCDRYKIGIITPPPDIDFKITIIVPPKNLDQAMVINPCPQQNHEGFAVQINVPRKQTREFFKVPPFTIKNKNSAQ